MTTPRGLKEKGNERKEEITDYEEMTVPTASEFTACTLFDIAVHEVNAWGGGGDGTTEMSGEGRNC
jgi:hypothetical protein